MNASIRLFPFLPLCTLLVSCGGNLSDLSPMPVDVSNGGRAVSVSVNPADDSQVVVASETGGLFKSTDTGNTWAQVSGNATFRFTDVLHNPSDPSVILATAAEDFKTANGGGIWRSTNGGSDWTQVALTTPDPACAATVTAYALSFEASQHRIFAGTSCGIAFSDNGGANWSFMPVATGYNNDPAYAIASPDAGKIVILTNGGVKVTANGGTSWSMSSSGLPPGSSAGTRTQIAVSPADANHIYFAFNYRTLGRDKMNGLYLSKDFANTWNMLVDQGGSGRPCFVKLTKTVAGSPPNYNLYYGDGARQLRKVQITHSANPALGAWTNLNADHDDAADLGFRADGITPLLLLSDGGLHKSTDGGITWMMTGAGPRGYNALQITEAVGQLHSSDDQADLYFGTQDNHIWASPDLGNTWIAKRCCEGFFLNIPRESLPAADTKLTGVSCHDCGNFISDPLLATQAGFPNPPNNSGNPFLLSPGSYIQNTKLPGLEATTVVDLTTNTGGTWVSHYGFSEEALDLPKKSGARDNPVVFTAVRYPGVTTDGDEIVRMKQIFDVLGSGTPVVSDVTGFGSLGTFQTMFAWYRPYGVDPTNPAHIILADITDDTMKVTNTAGLHWRNDTNLKEMVTDQGRFKFRMGSFTQVTCYGFDPDCNSHILVGTAQAGVVQSHNGGISWERVPGTDAIPYVSSFFFPGGHKVVISSYGRSLWQLKYKDCQPVQVRVDPKLAEPVIRWKGGYVPIRDINKPEVCPACGFILVKGGEVREILTDRSGRQIEEVAISSGELKFYSWDKAELPLPFKVSIARSYGGFQLDRELLSLVTENKKVKIVGLYVEGNLYKGALLAPGEISADQLPSKKALPPRISLGLPATAHISISDNQGFRFVVRGFDAQQPLEIEVDGRAIQAAEYKQAADMEGNISIEMHVLFSVGPHKVLVRQKNGQRTIQDVSSFHVTPDDESNQR